MAVADTRGKSKADIKCLGETKLEDHANAILENLNYNRNFSFVIRNTRWSLGGC